MPQTELRRLAEPLLEHPPLDPSPISELRRRVQRRRLNMVSGVTALVVVLVTTATASIALLSSDEPENRVEARPSPTSGPTTTIPLPSGVTANAGALQGQPPVAFAAKRAVVVISDGRAVALPRSAGTCCVRFGRRNWLAYLRGQDLWVTQPDGGRRMRLARGVADFTWSSGGNYVIALMRSKRGSELRAFLPHPDAPNGRFFVTPIAPHRDAEQISAAVLAASEGFSFVASSRRTNGPPTLFVVDLGNFSRPVTKKIEYELPDVQAPYCIFLATPTGRGSGQLIWPDEQCSASATMDGLPLTYVASNGNTHDLGQTLLKDSWIAWAPDGRRLLAVTGGGRDQYLGRTLMLCEPEAGTCTPLNGGDISLVDPAWSPDGSRIAYVATDVTTGLFLPDQRSEQYDHRKLFMADADGNNPSWMNGAGTGIADPRWTDSNDLLYVRDGSLSLIDVRSGQGEVVAGPLGVDAAEIINAPYEPTHGSWSDFFAVGR